MKAALLRLRQDLGTSGLLALALLAATTAFSLSHVRPLEERHARLQRELEARPAPGRTADVIRVEAAPAARMDAFYRFFERPERTDEWLAKLYGIATASGLQLRTGAYRLGAAEQRFARYEVNLPVAGSYAQIRRFLEGALAAIPVMSLDQVSFRRKATNDGQVEADIVLTLHFLRQ